MYVKCDRRLIVDHDLVTINVKLINGDSEINLYSELKFTHGYLNELVADVITCVKDCLSTIVDKYVTSKIGLNEIEISSIQKYLNNSDIPVDSYLLISVIDVQTFDQFWNMSEEEKVNVASLLKSRGNYKAHISEWSDAFKNYHRATKYLKGASCVRDEKHELHDIAKILLIKCMNNVALSCLKLSSGYNLCVKYCNYVLSFEPNNSKALFRKAKALTFSEEWRKALLCAQKCLEVEKDKKTVKDVLDLIASCQKHCKIQEEQERLLCKDILGKMEVIAIKKPDSLKNSICYDIDPWDNAMADEMLSIQQELEAFGEQMPPRSLSHIDFIDKIDEEDD